MDSEEKRSRNGIVWIILLGVFSVCLWAGSAVFIRGLIPDPAEAGQFGDMFGAINALFSGLALGGVVVAILYQRSELKLQRREVELTRQEMNLQTDTFNHQRFQDSFFHLLKQHTDLRNIRHDLGGFSLSEVGAIDEFLAELEADDQNWVLGVIEDPDAEWRKEWFVECYIGFDYWLDSYLFRFETLLLQIEIGDVDKAFYTEVLRGCLSASEVHLVSYLMMCAPDKFPKLYYLAKEYGLIEAPGELAYRRGERFRKKQSKE